MLAGCGLLEAGAEQRLAVENLSGGPVEVVYEASWAGPDELGWVDEPMDVLSLDHLDTAGITTLPGDDGCTVADLVALDAEGRQVERLGPPVCIEQDPSWTIDGRPDR
jgi:hypothetical protein